MESGEMERSLLSSQQTQLLTLTGLLPSTNWAYESLFLSPLLMKHSPTALREEFF